MLCKQMCFRADGRGPTTCRRRQDQQSHTIWRRCPHNIGPSRLIMSFLPRFHLFFFRNMGCGPFRCTVSQWVVPLVSCPANKHVPQRLRGAARHAKMFKTNTFTSFELLSSPHWSLRFHNVIFATFPLVFFFRTMGCSPYRWTVNLCVVTLLSCCASKCVPEVVRGAVGRAKDNKTKHASCLEMMSPQHWYLRLRHVIFGPF